MPFILGPRAGALCPTLIRRARFPARAHLIVAPSRPRCLRLLILPGSDHLLRWLSLFLAMASSCWWTALCAASGCRVLGVAIGFALARGRHSASCWNRLPVFLCSCRKGSALSLASLPSRSSGLGCPPGPGRRARRSISSCRPSPGALSCCSIRSTAGSRRGISWRRGFRSRSRGALVRIWLLSSRHLAGRCFL